MRLMRAARSGSICPEMFVGLPASRRSILSSSTAIALLSFISARRISAAFMASRILPLSSAISISFITRSARRSTPFGISYGRMAPR